MMLAHHAGRSQRFIAGQCKPWAWLGSGLDRREHGRSWTKAEGTGEGGRTTDNCRGRAASGRLAAPKSCSREIQYLIYVTAGIGGRFHEIQKAGLKFHEIS